MSPVFTKSAKGLREATGKTSDLPEDLRELLKSCKGQFRVAQIASKSPKAERESIVKAIADLVDQGYLREIFELRSDDPDPPDDYVAESAESDPTEDAGPEEVATDGMAERLRSGIAARRGQRDEQTIDELRLAEEKARHLAEENARREAAENLLREAEEKARRAAEEAARAEAEEIARRAAIEQARRDAEAQARRAAEENARREAEESARREAAAEARRQAEEMARLKQEEQEREIIRERLRLRRERKKKLMMGPVLLLVLAALVFGVYSVKFISLDGKRTSFEAMASNVIGLPVTVGNAHIELIPKVQLSLDAVTIGEAGERVTIQQLILGTPWSILWQLPAEFDSLHLEQARIPLAAFLKTLDQGAKKLPVKSDALTANGLIIVLEPKALPPLTAEARFTDGQLTSITGFGEDDDFGKLTLGANANSGIWRMNLAAQRFTIPLGVDLPLSDFSLSTQLAKDHLTIAEFKGWNSDGQLIGSGSIAWLAGWNLTGKLAIKHIDASKLAPGWFKDGFVSGQADIVASATEAKALYSAAKIRGTLSIAQGNLNGIDLERVVESRGIGEQFRFNSLESNADLNAGQVEFSEVRLDAGAISANGAVSLSRDAEVNGRFAIQMKTTRMPLGATISVRGTAKKPQFQR